MLCSYCGGPRQIERPCERCGFLGYFDFTPIFARNPCDIPLHIQAGIVARQLAENLIRDQEWSEETPN